MAGKKTLVQRVGGRAGATARKGLRTLLPAAARSHLKASIREALLTFESLFDEAVKALDRERRSETHGKSKRPRKAR